MAAGSSQRMAGVDKVFALLGGKPLLLPRIVAMLDSLSSRYGTFCVRGNHDCERDRAEAIESLLAETDITLLANAARVLDPIDVTVLGVETPWRGPIPPASADGFTIALSHSPDNLPTLARRDVQLCLAGHTHGGRLQAPVVGPVRIHIARNMSPTESQHPTGMTFVTGLREIGDQVTKKLRRAFLSLDMEGQAGEGILAVAGAVEFRMVVTVWQRPVVHIPHEEMACPLQ